MKKYEFHTSQPHSIYHQYDTNLEFENHLHTGIEFIHCYDGELLVNIEEVDHYLKPGDNIMILPGKLHYFKTPKYSRSYLCVFSYDFVSDWYRLLNNNKEYRELKSPEFKNVTAHEIDVFSHTNCSYMQKSFLYKICSLVSSNGYIITDKRPETLPSLVLDFIHKNFSETITVNQLAIKFGYNPKYLCNIFHHTLGTTVVDYINLVRLANSMKELRNTQDSITQIAFNNGFGSLRNFNRVFIEKCKFSPTYYRQNHDKVEIDLSY